MSFAFTRWADLPDDQVTRSKIVPAELRLRDVDVLVADPIIGGSQEADPLAHDFEDTASQIIMASVSFFKRLALGIFNDFAIPRSLGSGSFSSSRIFIFFLVGWDVVGIGIRMNQPCNQQAGDNP